MNLRISSPPRPLKMVFGPARSLRLRAERAQFKGALEAQGTSREALGREKFEQRVWEWREHYGGAIIEQLKRLGASCDYEDERFTLDEAYVAAVLRVFVALYEKGYIYRDRYM